MDYPMQPIPAHVGPDPASMLLALKRAVGQAQARWPRFQNLPLALTTGVGPGFSETYFPHDATNPLPGKLNVQLRSPEALNNPQNWPSDVGLEAIHGLEQNDPLYQLLTEKFVRSFSPDQRGDLPRQYQQDLQTFPEDRLPANASARQKADAYQEWLRNVQAQEYIRGGIFTDVIPGWVGPKGEGQYTPQQMQLLNQIQAYLKGGPAPAQMR